jgi:ribosomal protein L40E
MASPKKRPSGIAIFAVLWVLGSIFNLARGLDGVARDIGGLPLLSEPYMPEWFRFGIPAEMLINFFLVVVAFLSLYAIYGLFIAKSWSYHLALALSTFAVLVYVASTALYASAPAELLELGGITQLESVVANGIISIISIAWAGVTWLYLSQPHVKQYLKIIPPPAPVPVFNVEPKTTYSEPTLSAPSLEPAPATRAEEKKYCRYCRAENKTDADFCERCGRKIG